MIPVIPAFQHALRNHVQHGLQRGSVQPVAQVEKQRPGRRRVAPHGSRQVQLRTVDTEQGVVQRERALRPVQFDGGAQTGGHAIDQQFAVLPEKDVPVPEIERQHGVSLPEPGPQPQPGIPDIGEDLRFAVVEGHRTMTQRDVPDGDFTDGPHGIRRCIRRCAGRKRVGGGKDVPVRTPRPVPEGYRLVLVDSVVKHELASSAYNKRRQSCENVVAALKKKYPNVEFLRDATLEMLAEVKAEVSEEDYKRAEYVIEEIQRVLDVCEALERNDYETVGQKMYETHHGMSKLYEVSCEELDFLNDVAFDCGVTGSRVMGGGFGGCTINLVKNELYETFIITAKERFKEKFGRSPKVYDVVISNGARKIC